MTHIPVCLLLLLVTLTSASFSCDAAQNRLRVATFNVSIEASNYLNRKQIIDDPSRAKIVTELLTQGDHPHIKNVAEIIQRTRPDILLLNEFDYTPDPTQGIEPFIKNYLSISQNDQPPIDYPYYYVAPVNTGLSTPYDLDNDGKRTGIGSDAFGFGLYPGQYAMALLSRHPIKVNKVRSFQTFLWKDMPNALRPVYSDGRPWYSDDEWHDFRLSSKSHWDIPIETKAGTIHLIAAHPTPPTFDGAEDRNGKRNHDEIRLITDYLSDATYIYSDDGRNGGLPANTRFVVLGDLNSSPDEGDSINVAIRTLLTHPLVDTSCLPTSKGGQQRRPDSIFSAQHTAEWGLRVDYVIPSKFGLKTQNCGVFWPTEEDPLYALIATRRASSDHRLVWVDLLLVPEAQK